jgi:release factor glutamine methyltransferase
MNSKVLFNDLAKAITIDDSEEEIQTIAYIVLEKTLGISRTDVLAEREIAVAGDEDKRIKETIRRINNHEPVQYIFGETEFFGRTFKVNSSVLIPRPETEELVSLVKESILKNGGSPPRILDIGTGSGCIAVTLALELPRSKVFALDMSQDALETAKMNAKSLQADVAFINCNILNEKIPIDNLDVVVSNPPYIPLEEKISMKRNVTGFEPSLALFVSNEDPLIFYKVIVAKSLSNLNPGGLLAVEINERFGEDVANIFGSAGFTEVHIVKDLFRKDRIVKGIRP